MTRRLYPSFIALLAAIACGCGGTPQQAQAASAPAATTPVVTDTPTGMAHGDHVPHHGGVVYMYDDMHYEVVLDPGGHHRVFFTDSARADLPASAAASVTLTVERPKGTPETLNGVIDQQGESWLLDGLPVKEKETSVRVAFVAKGTPYWIDVPFISAPQ